MVNIKDPDTPKKMADVAVTFLPQKTIAPKYFGQIPKAASEAGGPEKWVWSALNWNGNIGKLIIF